MSETTPRRIDMRRWIPAERGIYDAMQAVEAMAPDVLLTQAVILLGKARECVADYVDREGAPVSVANTVNGANVYDPMRHRSLAGCAHSVTETCDKCHCPTCSSPVVIVKGQHDGATSFYMPYRAAADAMAEALATKNA